MKFIHLILMLCVSLNAMSAGNESIESFSKVKKLMQKKVYHDHRETI